MRRCSISRLVGRKKPHYQRKNKKKKKRETQKWEKKVCRRSCRGNKGFSINRNDVDYSSEKKGGAGVSYLRDFLPKKEKGKKKGAPQRKGENKAAAVGLRANNELKDKKRMAKLRAAKGFFVPRKGRRPSV